MLVSIGIPSYNHAEFLPAAIESCLNQTYKEIEIVVVDDNSSDNSLEIARQYERTHPSLIRVFTHPDNLNHGVSATVNLALSKSKGAFFCGLASDDVLYPERTEKQINYLLKNPDVGWVYSKAKRFGAINEVVGIDISQDPDPLETQIMRNPIWGITVLGRRGVWERTGDHDETLVYSDWDYWARMLEVSRVGFIDEVLAGARIHSRNTSVGIDWKKNHEYSLEVMNVLRTRPFQFKYLALVNIKRSAYLFELGRLSEAFASLEDAFNVRDSAAEYLRYFFRLTSAKYQQWGMSVLPNLSGISTDGAFITAKPNPVQATRDQLGKTLISWSTNNLAADQVDVCVYGAERGESLFANGARGSQEAPWIQTCSPMEFRLYSGAGLNRKLLDRVVVTRQA
jgi:alpha-1,3-rhamnosyltransferase